MVRFYFYSFTGNSDFVASDKSISFNTTNSSRICVSIPIIGDILYEGDEQFLVTFGNLPSAQARVGSIGQACVTIVEDDS